MYNVDIDTLIQTHMNIWTLIKIHACMYAAIGYNSWGLGDKPRDRFKLIEVCREAWKETVNWYVYVYVYVHVYVYVSMQK